MGSINSEKTERHDQEKSSVNITHDGRSDWYAPKLKRIDINTTLGGGGFSTDGAVFDRS